MHISLLQFRAWWTRQATFLPFREAAERLYQETRAADVLCNTNMADRPSGLDYHARQLVRYARYGKATLYGRRKASTVMEPIAHTDLWTGNFADGMKSWVTGGGVEYADLSLQPQDLGRVIRLVKQAVKDHDALLVWCRQHQHAPSHGD